MKEWMNSLTCSHVGLLSLMSSTWTSTVTGASNFPSVAVTLSVYLSLVSRSRRSFTIKPHTPSSSWTMANWPSGSPSAEIINNWVTSFYTGRYFGNTLFNGYCHCNLLVFSNISKGGLHRLVAIMKSILLCVNTVNKYLLIIFMVFKQNRNQCKVPSKTNTDS